ncbi:MAG TPA: sialidase family protein [Tepidisphaeraceae bacterium]|nr:sialidase family protein [Tepidisphaeraceae bacterium]
MTNASSWDVSRRQFVRSGLIAAAAVCCTSRRRAYAAPVAKVRDLRVISLEPQYYHGWPTLTRRKNGDLLVVCSGGREGHICPFGRVELMVSHDNGATWQWPQTVLDSAGDDRDAGILQTAQGTLLVTSFTSLAYEPLLKAAEKKQPGDPGAWPADRLDRWRLAHNRLSPQERQANLGQWMIRSTDGGLTWSGRYPSIVNSPHGPIQLRDGRLLYAGKELWTGQRRVGVCESSDDGKSWNWLAEIRPRAGDSAANYHELHAVEASDGRIIIHIRNQNKANSGETLQCESSDGGKTWTEPHSIGVWGLPSFLLRLHDDRLLMTYGHRRAPLGNQARVSSDTGRTWSDPLMISDDGSSSDLGYPSTVQLDDHTLLTIWYERMRQSPNAVLRQATWSID